MNKYIFILGLAVTAFISGCTSDDLTTVLSPEEERALIVEASKDSDVPITLGVDLSRGMTRAPLVSGVEDVFSTETDDLETPENEARYLGVFCLAMETQSNVDNIPSEISANNWKDDNTGLLVRMKNVPASVSSGVVSFLDHDYYYPMINWMTYNFYAYYPREGDENISFTSAGSGVLVKYITIDGSQDVIWGKAHPEKAPKVSSANDADPFCAKYFKLKKDSIANSPDPTPGNIAALYPKFEFKHLLSQFKFSIEPENAAAWAAIITDMYISNAIPNLQLIVANKKTPSTEGRLSKKKDSNTDKLYIKADGKDYNLFSSDPETLESQVSSIAIDATSVSVPGYIMLPPSGVGTEDYELCLEYSIGVTPQEPMKVKLTPPSGGFKAGQVYNIVVKVKL